MDNIGFIGVGAMGHWMVHHLLEDNHNVMIYDSNRNSLQNFEKSKAKLASSVTEVGEANDIIILMLPNSSVVEEVITGQDGLVHYMKEHTCIIDMSSSYAFSTKKIKGVLENQKIRLIDAPVSGGVKGAKNRSLTIMVGAEQRDYEDVEHILKCMGNNIQLVGGTGAGHGLKAINNYLSASTMYATAEAMILAEKLDIDPEVALKTINQSTGQSYSTHMKYPNYVLPRTFDSNFSMQLLLKDIKMALSMAKDVQMPMFLGATLVEVYEAAYSMGGEGQDHTEVIKFLEELAGHELGASSTTSEK